MGPRLSWWSAFELFQSAGENDALRFLADHPGLRSRYPAGQVIHCKGEPLTHFELLVKGKVASRIPTENGVPLTAAHLEAPDYLAPGMVFCQDTSLPVEIVALTPVEVHSWSLDEMLNFAQKSRGFLHALLGLLGEKVRFLAGRLEEMRSLPLRERLLRYLKDLALHQQQNGPTVQVVLPSSKEGLAAFFGVTRPSLSRCFSELSDEGLLRYSGRRVEWEKPLSP